MVQVLQKSNDLLSDLPFSRVARSCLHQLPTAAPCPSDVPHVLCLSYSLCSWVVALPEALLCMHGGTAPALLILPTHSRATALPRRGSAGRAASLSLSFLELFCCDFSCNSDPLRMGLSVSLCCKADLLKVCPEFLNFEFWLI